MKLLDKEKRVKYLFDFFNEHENDIVTVVFNNNIIDKAQLDTMYESEDEDEEYNVILMRNLKDNTLFEISYKNIPLQIILNGINIIN